MPELNLQYYKDKMLRLKEDERVWDEYNNHWTDVEVQWLLNEIHTLNERLTPLKCCANCKNERSYIAPCADCISAGNHPNWEPKS